jgi:hypothetical protein
MSAGSLAHEQCEPGMTPIIQRSLGAVLGFPCDCRFPHVTSPTSLGFDDYHWAPRSMAATRSSVSQCRSPSSIRHHAPTRARVGACHAERLFGLIVLEMVFDSCSLR